MKRLFIAVLILVLCVVTIVGCAKPAPAPKQTPASTSASAPTPASGAPKPQYGGVLKVISCKPIPDPVFGYPATSSSLQITPLVACLDSLLLYDRMGRTLPNLATDWKFSPDYKSLTLTLRKGVKFHDGTDFNAQAVKYNLEARKGLKMSDMALLSSIDVIDENTVRLNLSKYDNALLGNLGTLPGLMVSPTAIEKNGIEWAKTHAVGTGPFRFASYLKNASMKFERFDNYWQPGKPYLDAVEFSFPTDKTVAAMSFQAGEGQVIDSADVVEAAALRDKGYQTLTIGGRAVRGLCPDGANQGSIYANKKVREAIEYAIDRKAIVDACGHGFWEVCNQPCAIGALGYISDLEGRSYNPGKAKQLLAEAGYANGLKTKMLLNLQFSTGSQKDAMVAVQTYLKNVGIDAEMDIGDAARTASYANGGWKDALLWQLTSTKTPYIQTLRAFFPPVTFVSGYTPPGWVDLLNQALAATDFETQKALNEKLVRMAYDEAMMVPIYGAQTIFVLDKSVHDTGFATVDHIHWYPADTWLSK